MPPLTRQAILRAHDALLAHGYGELIIKFKDHKAIECIMSHQVRDGERLLELTRSLEPPTQSGRV